MARMFIGDKEIHGLKSWSLEGFGIRAKGFFDNYELSPKVLECKEGEIYTCTEQNTGRVIKARCVGQTVPGYVDMELVA